MNRVAFQWGSAFVIVITIATVDGCRTRPHDPDEPVQGWACSTEKGRCSCTDFKSADISATCGKWDCCYYTASLQLMDSRGPGDRCYCQAADPRTRACPAPANLATERRPTCP